MTQKYEIMFINKNIDMGIFFDSSKKDKPGWPMPGYWSVP
jgi:hypothetical protein